MASKELIEKVARAIADINHGHDRHWGSYYSDAQAAISTISTALQEPSEGARKALTLWDKYQPNIPTDEVIRQANDVAEALRAMLAASPLGEQSE